MYEGCDAPEHRNSGYCIRHTESGPRSILINTSKLVKEEQNNDVKVEFVEEEEELESEEETQLEIEDDTQEKEESKVKKKSKSKKKEKGPIQIIFPDKPNPSGAIMAIAFISIFSLIFFPGGDEEVICSVCCISGIVLLIVSNSYTSKQLEYQNYCIDMIEIELNKNRRSEDEIPKEPSGMMRFMGFSFAFFALLCLFEDETFGLAFMFAIFWFFTYVNYNSQIQKRNDFIEVYRKKY